MKADILIRVDATQKVALGHLKRCISLALGLREMEQEVIFAVAPDDYAEKLLKESGFPFLLIKGETNSLEDLAFILEKVQQMDIKAVVIDSYEIDSDYRQKLMDKCCLISIDDIGNENEFSHMVINSNLNAEKLVYPKSAGQLFLGIKYLLMGRDFWAVDQSKLSSVEQVKNILITMGGIDHYDLTTRILRHLENIKGDFSIAAIVGPYYENTDSIKVQAAKMKKEVEIAVSPAGLFEHIRKSSLAFCAGGQTLYELAALGCPTVGISLWANQKGNVDELSQMSAIYGLTYSDTDDFDLSLHGAVVELVDDLNLRKKLAQTSSMIVDGRGVERVSREIISICQKVNY